jgi:stress response protein SCP2
VVIGSRGKKVDSVCYEQSACGGAVEHSGDILTATARADDETIEVHLEDLPPDVSAVVFTVNSYRGQKFTDVRRAYCRSDRPGHRRGAVRFDITESAPRTVV